MKVLVIIAHPNQKSFNHAILDAFTKGLKESSHTFEIIDLYKIKFDPLMKPEDIAQFQGEKMPPDVLEQQKKISWADALVFISPIYWGNLPAILVGWFERVFSLGFAYRPPQGKEMGPQGLLHHKKALLINTTMALGKFYNRMGLEDGIKLITDEYILKGCGVQHVDHVFFYGVPLVNDDTRKKFLEKSYQMGKEF